MNAALLSEAQAHAEALAECVEFVRERITLAEKESGEAAGSLYVLCVDLQLSHERFVADFQQRNDADRIAFAQQELTRFDSTLPGAPRKLLLESITNSLPAPLAERARYIIDNKEERGTRKERLSALLEEAGCELGRPALNASNPRYTFRPSDPVPAPKPPSPPTTKGRATLRV